MLKNNRIKLIRIVFIVTLLLFTLSACGTTEEKETSIKTSVTSNETATEAETASISEEAREAPTEDSSPENADEIPPAESALEEADNEIVSISETPIENNLFSEIQGEYVYSSGHGAWYNRFTINPDGTFFGESSDFDAASGYRYSKYSGVFYDVEEIDDYTYIIKRSDLNYEIPIGTEWDENNTHYVCTEAYGMESGTDFYVFSPEKQTSEIQETFENEFVFRDAYADKLNHFVIWNRQTRAVFWGVEGYPDTEENEKTDTEVSEVVPVGDYAIEISDFFTGYKVLVPMLGMEKVPDRWENSFVRDGFYLDYDEEYDLCSIVNEGNPRITLYGCIPGEDVSVYEKELYANGWEKYADITLGAMYVKLNDENNVCMIDLYYEEDKIVTSWFWNNWPEGDYDFSFLYD